jgi:hypothetical protein
MRRLVQADPGGEVYIRFVEKKLTLWHAQMIRSGDGVLDRTIRVSDGTAIYVNILALGKDSRGRYAFRDRVRISGNPPFGRVRYGVADAAFASVTSKGAPLRASFYRFYTIDPATIGFRSDGIRGTEFLPQAITTAGADTFVPTRGGNNYASSLGTTQWKKDDGRYEMHQSFLTGAISAPYNAFDTRIRYDGSQPAGSRWGELTGAAYLAAATGASIGLSSFDTSTSNPYMNKYTLPNPFPGGTAGDITFKTPIALPAVAPLGILDPGPTGAFTQCYITSVTTGAVVTDFDVDNTTVLAYGCWATLQGAEETWVSTRDPETLVLSTTLHHTRTWKVYALLRKTPAGVTTVETANGATALHSLSGGSSYVMDTGSTNTTSPFAAQSTNFPAAGADEQGNYAEIRVFTTWSAATGPTANAGPSYRTGAGTTQRMELYSGSLTGTATVELLLNGSVVGSDSLAGSTQVVPYYPLASQNVRAYFVRRGMFGMAYQYISANTIFSIFWNGTALAVEAAPGGAAPSDFAWGVSSDGATYAKVWNGVQVAYYVAGALVLTIPLVAGEAFRGLDEVSPRTFYTSVVAGAAIGQGRTYKVSKDANTGTWSYTAADMAVQTPWVYNSVSRDKAFTNLIDPYTMNDRGLRGNLTT